MRIIFMGTPDFAVHSLKALLTQHEVVAVVTQPDKPKGRGKKMLFTPVKEYALEQGLSVYQPQRVREDGFFEILESYQPDLIAVTAFGQILPESILNLPKYGCINVHGSLLPKYRGAAPMQWAMIDGDEMTGITTMYMAKGMDTGDMLLTCEVPILPEDDFGALHDKMAEAGAQLLLDTIKGLEEGSLTRIEQNHDLATHAPMLTKETGHIDWSKKSGEILCLMRGLSPAPGAFTLYEDVPLKLFGAVALADDSKAQPGEIIQVNKKSFVVKTGDGALEVTQVQAQGGKRMPTDAYLRGHAMIEGTLFK